MTWYTRLKAPRSKAERLRDASRDRTTDKSRNRKPPTIRNQKLVFWSTYSRGIWLHGYKVKVASRYHIAKLFDVPVSTIHRWDYNGVLPEPYMWLDGPTKPYPVYLSSQVRVLLVVVRDLVQDGYVSIPWDRLEEHKEMLGRGYAAAMKAFEKRLNPPDTGADRYGVILD